MKPECRVFFVRQPRMRSLWMQPAEESLEKTFTIMRPLIQTSDEEWRGDIRQPLSSGMASCGISSWLRGCSQSYFVEETFDESPDCALAAAHCPRTWAVMPWSR